MKKNKRYPRLFCFEKQKKIAILIDMRRKSRQHSPLRRFFASRLFLLIALIVIALVALSYARAYYQDYTIRKEISDLQEEVQQLQRKRLESMEILAYVKDDAFVEEKARTDLHMKKPGEYVMFVEHIGTRIEADQGSEEESGQEMSNPLKWWYYFTHTPISHTEG